MRTFMVDLTAVTGLLSEDDQLSIKKGLENLYDNHGVHLVDDWEVADQKFWRLMLVVRADSLLMAGRILYQWHSGIKFLEGPEIISIAIRDGAYMVDETIPPPTRRRWERGK